MTRLRTVLIAVGLTVFGCSDEPASPSEPAPTVSTPAPDVAPPAPAIVEEPPAKEATRKVAVTIDDLPFAGPVKRAATTPVDNMRPLVTKLTKARVPIWGFANGRRRADDAFRVWIDAGFPLGNHTFSHPAYSKKTIAEFLDNVTKNEDTFVDRLDVKLRGTFFRHPYLDYGHTEDKVVALAEYLAEHEYRLAPVSLDTVDYQFNVVYLDRDRDPQVADRYFDHIDECAAYFEGLSKQLYDREIPLVMLLHANPLNADHFDGVLATLVARGYEIITLEEALADPAYVEHGLRPPYVPRIEDRNFLNHVAAARGIDTSDSPSGDADFRRRWKPKLLALP